jgi:hypothetical protein
MRERAQRPAEVGPGKLPVGVVVGEHALALVPEEPRGRARHALAVVVGAPEHRRSSQRKERSRVIGLVIAGDRREVAGHGERVGTMYSCVFSSNFAAVSMCDAASVMDATSR